MSKLGCAHASFNSVGSGVYGCDGVDDVDGVDGVEEEEAERSAGKGAVSKDGPSAFLNTLREFFCFFLFLFW